MRVVIVGAGTLGTVVAKRLLSSGLSSDGVVLVARDLSNNQVIYHGAGIRGALPPVTDEDVVVVTGWEAEGATFAELPERVPSPNGTTAAVLDVLRHAEAGRIARRAICAAFESALQSGCGVAVGDRM